MKKTKWIAIPVLALHLCICCDAQSVADSPFIEGEKHLVLMNPTVDNLRTFLNLTEKDILILPPELKVVGIFHSKSSYNFAQSDTFIANGKHHNIRLWKLAIPLSPSLLFTENAGSAAFREIFEKSEGVIFFGGPDIPPEIYGEQMNLLTVVTDPYRNYLELSLLFHLLGGSQNEDFTPFLEDKPEYRILGICLGMQTMNVACGGTLFQDIPSQVYGHTTVEDTLAAERQTLHRNYYRGFALDNSVTAYTCHQITIETGLLADANAGISDLPHVWSSHHQAVKKLGGNLKPTAWSLDGRVIEAIEHKFYPNVLGVQFHPERVEIYDAEHGIKQFAGQRALQSFQHMYPAEHGERFHQNFWHQISDWFTQPQIKCRHE